MSKIQWTDLTINPVSVIGGGNHCEKISPGCLHCYAEGINKKTFFKGNGIPYKQTEGIEFKLDEKKLASWARMRVPKKIFVGSMTDLFGDWIPMEWHFKLFDAMAAAPLQIFQLLTKRPKNMEKSASAWSHARRTSPLPVNIWCGVSVESQDYTWRLDDLRQVPSVIKFVSFEPLLGSINNVNLDYIDWAIIGGESGSKARPCRLKDVQDLIYICKQQNLAVFMKQFGDNNRGFGRKGADFDSWPEWAKIREFPFFPTLGN
jgi:protein gp37